MQLFPHLSNATTMDVVAYIYALEICHARSVTFLGIVPMAMSLDLIDAWQMNINFQEAITSRLGVGEVFNCTQVKIDEVYHRMATVDEVISKF